MFRAIAITAALVAPVCVQADAINEYILQEVAGVYSVYMPELSRQQAPLRLDYADGDLLVMEQGGTKRAMPIHTVDTAQGIVNLLDPSGDLATLSIQFGHGKMVFANGSQLSLSFVRKLTDIDYAALGSVAAPALEPVPEPAAQQGAPATALVPIKASFDCEKASTAIEGMICGNAELASLDVRTSAAYKEVRDGADDRAALRREQIEWLKHTRNLCKTPECLFQAYTERAEDLEQLAQYLSKPAEFR